MSNLKGIVIDAGHGGDDPGASGNGIIEKDLTLKISKDLATKLRNLGLNVYETRTSDETISPSDRVKRILNAYGNDKDVLVISNHINAGGGDGAEVIYALRNKSTLSNLILGELEKKGQNVRKAYQRRLPSDTSKDYYFIHRETGNTEPIIIEYGFLDSTSDDVEQLKNNYTQYVDAVVNAIKEYYNLSTDLESQYIVVSGDSLWSIAKKYNITVDNLKKYNNLTSNLLSIGQILNIPQENSSDENIYTVEKGDSLYSIAKKYGTTVSNIINENNLSTTLLSIGQKLKIPTSEKIYTVVSGDTLYSIARKNNTTVNEIMTKNNLTSSLLSIGQKIVL